MDNKEGFSGQGVLKTAKKILRTIVETFVSFVIIAAIVGGILGYMFFLLRVCSSIVTFLGMLILPMVVICIISILLRKKKK